MKVLYRFPIIHLMKTLLALSAAAFVAILPAHADSHHGGGSYRGGGGGGRYHGGGGYYGHRGGGGRYYYFGGLPYFYPIGGYGFGDPFWYGGYYGGFPGGFGGYGQPYEGRIANENVVGAEHGAKSLPGAVQRQLAERGYYKGGIDGQFGPASKGALRRFQNDNGIKSSGLIDEPSLKALGFEAH